MSFRSWLPAAFVLFSLFALLAAPLILNARIGAIRSGVVEPAQQARGEVNEIRQALSEGEAAIRGLLLTGEERFYARLLESQEAEHAAYARLLPLAARLDPGLAEEARLLEGESRRVAEERVALLAELEAGGVPTRLLEDEEARHDRILERSGALKSAIVETLAGARSATRGLERVGDILTIALAFLALASAVLVMRTGRHHRRRAVEEAELRSAAFSVTEATGVDEVLHRIVASASRDERGEHAYVERIVSEDGTVEVVATAGTRTPDLGTRVPYPGSLAAEALRSGRPEVVEALGSTERPISRLLRRACPDCTALVVPLVVDDDPQGALVVLRRRRSRFSDREAEKKRALGALAALALRKAVLLKEARDQHADLRRVVASRQRLVRGFSHDVKNPLSAVDGHAQLLAEGVVGELTDRQLESVERIRSGIGSALGLINDLVDLGRAEAGQLDIHRERVDVPRLLASAAAEYDGAADAAGLRLRADLPPLLPAIHSDPRRIRQALSNLLSNALKYTPHGGEVCLSAEVQEGRRADDPGRWVAIHVEDTGPGIPEEERSELFEEFKRLEPGTAAGAGVGLAITDRIVRLLGGEISVASEVGAGSTFTIRLPVDPAPSAAS